jgi:hypothetical protein
MGTIASPVVKFGVEMGTKKVTSSFLRAMNRGGVGRWRFASSLLCANRNRPRLPEEALKKFNIYIIYTIYLYLILTLFFKILTAILVSLLELDNVDSKPTL